MRARARVVVSETRLYEASVVCRTVQHKASVDLAASQDPERYLEHSHGGP